MLAHTAHHNRQHHTITMFLYKGTATFESKIVPLIRGCGTGREIVFLEKAPTARESLAMFISTVVRTRDTPQLGMLGVGAVIRDAQSGERIHFGSCDLWYFGADPTHVYAVVSDRDIPIQQAKVGELELPMISPHTPIEFHMRQTTDVRE
jgi:hypothetical protein